MCCVVVKSKNIYFNRNAYIGTYQMFRNVFQKLHAKYTHAVHLAFSDKYLIYTNITTSLSISMIGDCIEQTYELHKKHLDVRDLHRTALMGFSGAVSGVICHHWYIFLDKILVGRTLKTAVQKLLLDQCIFSPLVILSFFATVAIFEDDPLESFNDEVKSKFWTLYKAEWVVWPPAQMINFLFLPTKYRVIYDNTISLGYDIFTSQVKHVKKYDDPNHHQ